jgi:hypothetical protein
MSGRIGAVKRLIRWLIDVVAALSLLAALAILPIWMSRILPQSYWLQYYFMPLDTRHNRLQVGFGLDIVDVIHTQWLDHTVVGPSINDQDACAAFIKQFPPPKTLLDFSHFRIATLPLFRKDHHDHLTMGRWAHMLVIPYGMLTFMLMTLPAICFVPRITRWIVALLTVRPGCCAGCGYDLRHTPHRCPECGKIPTNITSDAAPLPPLASLGG